MNRSPESIEVLIRDGTRLKKRIESLTRLLGHQAADNGHWASSDSRKSAGNLTDLTTDVFATVCNFRKIHHAGIYFLNRQQQLLKLAYHFNLPGEFLATASVFNQESWQFKSVSTGHADFNCLQKPPLQTKLIYESLGIQELAFIPLVYNNRVVGCLNLAIREGTTLSSFEKTVLEGLSAHISRAVALRMAEEKLIDSGQELEILISRLDGGFQPVAGASLPDNLPVFFSGIREDIRELGRAICHATDQLMGKIKDGLQRRELPFMKRKVDAILNEIDILSRMITGLRLFCISQSNTIEQGMTLQENTCDMNFLNRMADLNQAMDILVRDGNKPKGLHNVFFTGNFKPIKGPALLSKLKTKIDRLNPN
jgi:hypothetical protein